MFIKKIILLGVLLGTFFSAYAGDVNVLSDVSSTKEQLIKQIRSKYEKLSKIGKRVREQQELLSSFMDMYVQLRMKIMAERKEKAQGMNVKISEQEVRKNITKEWNRFHRLFFTKIQNNKILNL